MRMNITNEMSSEARLGLPRSHGVTFGKEIIAHCGQVSVLTSLESG